MFCSRKSNLKQKTLRGFSVSLLPLSEQRSGNLSFGKFEKLNRKKWHGNCEN